MSDERVYRCSCGDLAHSMALWSDPEDNEWGDVDVSMVVPWMPLRWRLRQAWNVLRGRPGTMAFVSLSPDNARGFATDLMGHATRAGTHAN